MSDTRNKFTKDGLTGNSGFRVEGISDAWHVNANYAATENMVFVESGDMGWKRMKEADAVEKKRRIIRCSYCTKPAISLDHCWPYLQEASYCDKHRNWQELVGQ